MDRKPKKVNLGRYWKKVSVAQAPQAFAMWLKAGRPRIWKVIIVEDERRPVMKGIRLKKFDKCKPGDLPESKILIPQANQAEKEG